MMANRGCTAGWKVVTTERSEDMVIEGYVAKYNKPTIFKGKMEVIRPGAFDSALRAIADGKRAIKALYHHMPHAVLGNTATGTLSLISDAVGLFARINLPNTTWGRDAYESVRSGHCGGGSFGFYERTSQIRKLADFEQLLDLDLSEVTVTPSPVYDDTTMAPAARSLSATNAMRKRVAALTGNN